MSLKDWKEEFYPIPAGEVPIDDAIEHSLQKWIGLRKENLNRHNVWYDPSRREVRGMGHTSTPVEISSKSCALCHRYIKYEGKYPGCGACPLVAVRTVPCDRSTDGSYMNPWRSFTVHENPEPMIDLIQAALRASAK
jgi:hypothetical protein